MQTNLKETLIKNIKMLREQKGLTREELSLLLEFDNSYISKLENGNTNPTVEKLEKICNFFKLRAGELFEDIFINESDEIVPSNDIYKIKLAKNLRTIREAKGLTREEMSFALKFDSSYVSKLEKGRINITIDKIILIADFLGVRLPDLFK